MADVFEKDLSSSTFFQAMVRTGIRPFYRSTHTHDGETLVDGRSVIMAGSNDYLGLSTDPRVIAAAADAVRRYGTSCSGARTLNGTLPLHGELEARLANFLGTEAAAVVTTGFQANLAIAALLGKDDIVFSDMANHASLVDGLRLGAARRVLYRHSDMDHLAELLTEADPDAAKVIVTDGMFSMGGDLCHLPELTALARRHHARLIVDGAHDIGLLGARGRGVAEHFGMHGAIDFHTGTLSKCFGSTGGILAGPAHVVDYLRHAARSILFSASMPPAALAAGVAALDIIESEPWRRDRVLNLAERLRNGLALLGYDTGQSVTPVVPVRIGEAADCARMWQKLLDEGVFTNAIGAPGVPEGQCVIRVAVQATHTDDHLARILDAFAAARRRPVAGPRSPQTTDQEPVSAR
ncbi:aminotransferase class I/II-fold pyridoxal phosphate-dependent enzyme [Streptomyces gobiensis]|uniref:aminotransferase class I/II-fold pyridoxal phosphate-dependent enzyme n=1 Tax=Streptomyces gobiensis TaxID=2875706 RepID=UPI001E53909C|nr:pyridoxal phosphate-dependent aminotransferase family protein [Streptomyces gobiensis]UGY91519.1 pyridoxal phosphate-dependent aminotransferase family protein [Streptomyces gobiensis]